MLTLLKIFLAIFIPIFLFLLYARRFRNPYKNTFIFGKKGAGKSTLMVKYMLKYKKRGWKIYTDIKDCVVPDVRIIKAADLERYVPEPGSAVFLDEVGISFDCRQFEKFPPGLRDFFKLQRKYRVCLFQNSQSYDVDKKIRDCVDGMVLQSSICDVIGVTRPIYKSVVLTAPDGSHESRIAEQLKFAPIWRWKFTWLPRYFKYFDSFDAPHRPKIKFTQVTQEMYSTVQRTRKANKLPSSYLFWKHVEREEVGKDRPRPPAPHAGKWDGVPPDDQEK